MRGMPTIGLSPIFIAADVTGFNLTDELKSAIDEARTNYKAATSKLDLDYVIFDKFGRDCIKQNKLSPDSFMQLSLQVYCLRYY